MPCLQERLNQGQDPLVPDSRPDPAYQLRVRDLIETRFNICFKNPMISLGPEVVDLSDRVLRPPPRAETVRPRLKIRLENGLQHQLHGSLHQAVHRGGNTQAPEFPRTALRDQTLPHRQRGEHAGLQLRPRVRQEPRDVTARDDGPGRNPVHPRRARPLVLAYPVPGHHQERRVTNEVIQIIEPAARIPGRPKVQLGLHTQYPRQRLIEARPRLTGIHQRLLSLQATVPEPAGPLRRARGFPAPGLLRALRPTPGYQRTTRLPATPLPGRPGRDGNQGWFPRSPSIDRRVRPPALPQRHRHGYAAVLRHGLPDRPR